MKREEFLALQPGRLIRHKGSVDAYQIVRRNERPINSVMTLVTFTAVRVIDASNEIEWDEVNEFGEVISS